VSRAGVLCRCKQCHGKGTFVLYRGRGREVLPCSCLAAKMIEIDARLDAAADDVPPSGVVKH
jgi:hypothetical protein